jgi:hypothetical protein
MNAWRYTRLEVEDVRVAMGAGVMALGRDVVG